MREDITNGALGLFVAAATPQLADGLLSGNAETAEYGLTLTAQEALMLAQTRAEALKAANRVELGGGAARAIISAFCDSPYITQDDYAETLQGLIELFYAFKNDTYDRVSDEALIRCMKRAFDGECRGSLELLADEALPELARRLNVRAGERGALKIKESAHD